MAELTALDGLVVDLDGVVWVATSAVPGSVAALEQLRKRLRVVFVTNDPRGSRTDYVAQLRALGIDADEREIVTSSSALASLLADERRGST
ncbi:MAG TPA: hypothetical protein VE615_05900, partial [Gaiellaceae bacterium]|nr:hypothetical protein [Gaiellaceae bacterium]